MLRRTFKTRCTARRRSGAPPLEAEPELTASPGCGGVAAASVVAGPGECSLPGAGAASSEPGESKKQGSSGVTDDRPAPGSGLRREPGFGGVVGIEAGLAD